MSTNYNSRIVTDGLVFYYDMNNTQKSWKGAPTTNLVTSLDFTTYGRAGLASVPVGGFPDVNGGNTAYKLVANTSIADYDFVSLPASQPAGALTISACLKSAGVSTGSLFLTQGGNHGGIYDFTTGIATNTGGAGNTVGMTYIKDGWWWCWVSNSGTTSAGFRIGPQNGAVAALAGDGVNGILVCNPQVEQQTFATPFVFGSRSNTQALLDLTGKNTITIPALTYDSNNTFRFSDTTTRISTGYSAALRDFTVAAWFKSTGYGVSSWDRIIDSNYPDGVTLMRHANMANTWGGGVIEGTDPYGIYLTLTDNQWHYLVSVRQGTAHTLYGDGVTNTVSNTVSANAISTNVFGVGAWYNGANNQNFVGSIPIVQIYDRALSTTEVLQNFNAHRGRYSV